MRWFALLLLGVIAGDAMAQAPPDDITQKQVMMLAAEAQYFSALAKQQKDELDKLKLTPCGGKEP